jgi:hypothetical protein
MEEFFDANDLQSTSPGSLQLLGQPAQIRPNFHPGISVRNAHCLCGPLAGKATPRSSPGSQFVPLQSSVDPPLDHFMNEPTFNAALLPSLRTPNECEVPVPMPVILVAKEGVQ